MTGTIHTIAVCLGALVLLAAAAATVIGPEFVTQALAHTLGTPYFYLFLGVAFTLEQVMPAQRQQPRLSRGAIVDFIWFAAALTVIGAGLTLWGSLLGRFYERYLTAFTIDLVQTWPVAARVIVFLLVIDFLVFITHLAHHKVRPLWFFHLVHHSQREMSFFTEERDHPVERVLNFTARFFPLAMLGVPFPTNVHVGMVITWYTWFCHGNIRTNLGPLKYILVTPQSHRVHHSVELRHWDRNFAPYFTLWDRVFGTFYGGYDEYPPTGIPHLCFPYEQEAHGRHPLVMFWQQLVYPFRLLLGYQPVKREYPDTVSSA